MMRFAAIGECMVELTYQDSSTLSLQYAGDTFNTTTYLARLARGTVQVDYVTRLGIDHHSDQIIERMQMEGIGTSMIERIDGRTPGLYLVRTDSSGERTFTYHRSTSPAREMFTEGAKNLDSVLSTYDAVYLSAITLQILTPAGRIRLCSVLDDVRRAGGIVIFDTNYRASGWLSRVEARDAIDRALRRCDIAFPTFDDERDLYGDADPYATAERLADIGVREVVVKNGAQGCLVRDDGHVIDVSTRPVAHVVDTTGAGDSFNAAYLAARFSGASAREAAGAGNELAREVIQWPGAIMPADAMTDTAQYSAES